PRASVVDPAIIRGFSQTVLRARPPDEKPERTSVRLPTPLETLPVKLSGQNSDVAWSPGNYRPDINDSAVLYDVVGIVKVDRAGGIAGNQLSRIAELKVTPFVHIVKGMFLGKIARPVECDIFHRVKDEVYAIGRVS